MKEILFSLLKDLRANIECLHKNETPLLRGLERLFKIKGIHGLALGSLMKTSRP